VREDVPLEWDTLEEKNRYKEEEAIVFHNVQNASAGVALGQVAKLQKRCAVGFNNNNNISFDRRETGFLVMTEEENRFAEERLDSCPICMEGVERCNAALVRPCRHLYCAVCIQTHIQHGASACPLCRGPLSRRNVCVPPLEQSNNSNGSSNNPFRQSKSPKIEKLMNLITGSEQDDKFLVFSNFKDVVRYTKMRLEDESIPCVAFLAAEMYRSSPATCETWSSSGDLTGDRNSCAFFCAADRKVSDPYVYGIESLLPKCSLADWPGNADVAFFACVSM